VGATLRALAMPPLALVKGPNAGEQSLGGCIEPSRKSRNLVSQFVAINHCDIMNICSVVCNDICVGFGKRTAMKSGEG
jgi:hypothetical protein